MRMLQQQILQCGFTSMGDAYNDLVKVEAE